MPDVTTPFLEQGVMGAIILALAVVVIVLHRQNQALHEEMRQTLREVIPAITALEKAADLVQRGAQK